MFFKKKVKKEYVYVISGYCWETESFGCNSKTSYPMIPEAYSCMALAKKRIREIIRETEAEAAEMDYGCSCEWKKDFNTLEITFDNGIIENWVIYELPIK